MRYALKGQRQQYRHEFHIDPDTIPELYFRTRIAGVMRPGARETFERCMRGLAGLRGIRPEVYLGEELKTLEVPTPFIWREKESLAPIEDARALSERMPDSRFVVLDGVGHFPFLEKPAETGSLITEFAHRPESASTEPMLGSQQLERWRRVCGSSGGCSDVPQARSLLGG